LRVGGEGRKIERGGGFWPANPKSECGALGLGLVKKIPHGGRVIGVVDEG
jgi:hypothetical protein